MSDSKFLKGPFKADFNGGYVFSGPENFMFGQVRGWGQLQYQKDAEAVQNSHLQFMVDALNEKANPSPAQAAYMRLARYVGPQSEHRKNEGPLADVVIAELEKTKEDLKKAGDEIANLAHPEFGDMGRLQEEISNLKKEVEWLRYYQRNVYQCLGPGDDDINMDITKSFVREKGIGALPEKERIRHLEYLDEHKNG
jgi:hypothetical protein